MRPSICFPIFVTVAIVQFRTRVPTRTGKTGKPGKMGRHFPVREKSGNFEQTGKVREKSGKITQNTGKFREFQTNILFVIFFNNIQIYCVSFAKMDQVFTQKQNFKNILEKWKTILEKSGKSQGILSVRKSGNPEN